MRVRREMENDQIGYRRGVEGAAPYSFRKSHGRAIVGDGALDVPHPPGF